MKIKLNSTMTMVVLALLVLGVLIFAAAWKNVKPSPYGDFAQCLNDGGAKIYVAYWCSACAKQKEMFGSAWRKLNTVECSSPGSRTFDLCPDITSTPTWEGPDGTRTVGVQTFAELSETYGCPLPATQ